MHMNEVRSSPIWKSYPCCSKEIRFVWDYRSTSPKQGASERSGVVVQLPVDIHDSMRSCWEDDDDETRPLGSLEDAQSSSYWAHQQTTCAILPSLQPGSDGTVHSWPSITIFWVWGRDSKVEKWNATNMIRTLRSRRLELDMVYATTEEACRRDQMVSIIWQPFRVVSHYLNWKKQTQTKSLPTAKRDVGGDL